MDESRVVPALRVTLGGTPWVALLSLLLDAAGHTAGVSVTLASLDTPIASYRQIEKVLLLGGLVSAPLACALSYLLPQRTGSRVP